MHKNKKEVIVKKIRKFIVSFDYHYPDYSVGALKIILKFTKDFKPDIFVFGGDMLDLNCISHWNIGKPGETEGQYLIDDYKGLDKSILTPTEKVLPKKCKKVWIDGNHEYFLDDYVARNPKIRGLVEFSKILRLKEREWERIPYSVKEDPRSVYKLSSKLYVSHGWYTNINYTKKTVQNTERSIIVGHKHTFQSYSKENLIDTEDYHTCYGIGCMSTLKPSYGKGRPNNWITGFAYGYLQRDGSFNVYPVFIVHNRAVINGKLYDGNK